MKFVLTLALGLSASVASAQVSQSDQDAMMNVMEQFGASFATNTTPQFFGDRMHPAVWDTFAKSLNRPTDVFKELSIAGMRAYYDTLDISDFDLIEDTALYGTSLEWTWAVFGANTVIAENGGAPEADCVTMMVFGKDGEWFISESADARELVIAALPGMTFAKFNHPACEIGGS